jgi:hypothetical protein
MTAYGSADFIINGKSVIVSASININLGSGFDAFGNPIMRETVENHTMSKPISVIEKPFSPSIEFSFRDDYSIVGGDINTILSIQSGQANVSVKTGGRIHRITGGSIIGTGQLSSENGDVTGFSVTDGKYSSDKV